MSARIIGRRQFTDGATRPVYEGERGLYVVEDGERIDGVWLAPEAADCDAPLIVDSPQNGPHCYLNIRPLWLYLAGC
jgi:hypothetical protein